ncbi:hypothetical protein CPB83DRAFT_511530 [Crepidotus variabilis]|uniref:Uncharacterized protein n=1 Tax=Crepidotus variabilis TaxID=179855 RepID=A0A9P6EB98_9AGAR|nr:hypothetical protein CPB83DRAFT_511530 [Crepidotus variabilis]
MLSPRKVSNESRPYRSSLRYIAGILHGILQAHETKGGSSQLREVEIELSMGLEAPSLVLVDFEVLAHVSTTVDSFSSPTVDSSSSSSASSLRHKPMATIDSNTPFPTPLPLPMITLSIAKLASAEQNTFDQSISIKSILADDQKNEALVSLMRDGKIRVVGRELE